MFNCESGLGLGTVKSRENLLTSLVTLFSGYSSALPRLTGGSLASTAAARSTSARRTDPGTARSSPSTKMVKTMKLINFRSFYPHFRFCFQEPLSRRTARLMTTRAASGSAPWWRVQGQTGPSWWVTRTRGKYFLWIKYFFHFQACAPRYIYYVYKNRRDPVGICYTGRLNSNQFRPFRPCVGQGKVEPLSNMLTVSGLRPSLHLVFAKFDEKGTYRYLFHRKK